MSFYEFKFDQPSHIFFGEGAIEGIKIILSQIKPNKVLLVSDTEVSSLYFFKTIKKIIENESVEVAVFTDVEPNPTTTIIAKAINICKHECSDLIIGLGGGSSIDTAKSIAFMATNEGNITDYEGTDKIRNKPIPLVAIPTTAGSGSEVTPSTVITEKSRNYKLAIISKLLIPPYVIADPILTVSKPRNLTATTGIDALTHALESYISKIFNPICELLALNAISTIGKYLPLAYNDGNNIYARSKMLMASIMAGMSFSYARLGIVHAMSHPLSGFFNVPHGVANSVLLAHAMRFNRNCCHDKYARIAEALGEDIHNQPIETTSFKSIYAIEKLIDYVGIPPNLKNIKANKETLRLLTQDALKSGNIAVNPREVEEKDIIMIYSKILKVT